MNDDLSYVLVVLFIFNFEVYCYTILSSIYKHHISKERTFFPPISWLGSQNRSITNSRISHWKKALEHIRYTTLDKIANFGSNLVIRGRIIYFTEGRSSGWNISLKEVLKCSVKAFVCYLTQKRNFEYVTLLTCYLQFLNGAIASIKFSIRALAFSLYCTCNPNSWIQLHSHSQLMIFTYQFHISICVDGNFGWRSSRWKYTTFTCMVEMICILLLKVLLILFMF